MRPPAPVRPRPTSAGSIDRQTSNDCRCVKGRPARPGRQVGPRRAAVGSSDDGGSGALGDAVSDADDRFKEDFNTATSNGAVPMRQLILDEIVLI